MNASQVVKVKNGDYVRFGEANMLAGQIIELNRNTATVQISEWQTAVVGIAAIIAVNYRHVGDNTLTVA